MRLTAAAIVWSPSPGAVANGKQVRRRRNGADVRLYLRSGMRLRGHLRLERDLPQLASR